MKTIEERARDYARRKVSGVNIPELVSIMYDIYYRDYIEIATEQEAVDKIAYSTSQKLLTEKN